MHRNMWFSILFTAATASLLSAQWINHPTSGTPRTKDGKPNLTAPVPKAPDGKPDLSGIWQAAGAAIPDLIRLAPNGGQNGLGEDIPTKYFINILADFTPETSPLKTPFSGAALTSARSDDPGIHCLPTGMPMVLTVPSPIKIVQTPQLMMMLVEADTSFRQIFLDGRKHPEEMQPSWLGSSVGKWEGDQLVVETAGLNERSWLDASGHTHSDQLRITERLRRIDFGHMNVELTLNDPKTFSKPVTIRFNMVLKPDTDLIESFCSENEKDLSHMIAVK